jgi:hypothetical protein
MSEKILTGEELGTALMEFIGTLEDIPVTAVLGALSVVTATVACEAGYEEEKAVYAFRKCYGESKRRIEKLKKVLN